MKISAIIAEYNPFHNGHHYQIEKIKKNIASHIVVVMSGNFVQRGDFAVFDKYNRGTSAVMSGADLVVELPTRFCLSSAEGFSSGAVSIINSLGCVDFLSFGAECEEVATLREGNFLLNHKELELKKYLKKGYSYPRARMAAAEKLNQRLKLISGDDFSNLSQPNNILGMEYLRALERSRSKTIPYLIKRHKIGHDSQRVRENFASATKIRELIYSGEDWERYLPENIFLFYSDLIKSNKIIDRKKMDFMVMSYLKRINEDDILDVSDVSEGLENRILDKIKKAKNLDTLYKDVKTKRYTEARIRRIILNTFLEINKNEEPEPKYIKVLAFNEKGVEILRKAKKTATLPIITNLSEVKNISKSSYNLEILASALYGFAMKKQYNSQWEFKKKISKEESKIL